MFLYKATDKLVFSILKKIDYGYLEITTFDGKILSFGNSNENLKVKLKIQSPNFTYNLIRTGSVGLAESYMRNEFETDNLSNLIEITARNIKIIHKFAGALDIPILNYVKNKIIKNTKERSKKNIAKHYDWEMNFFHSGWMIL